MKNYIKPQTEIITGYIHQIAVSTNDTVGDENEFANGTSYEAFEDNITTDSRSLWAE